ncbi:MAG: helix-turn-helix domain-containing protein [candidate division WOR-3 bacterium]|nr:helix-turn-helix domain-containing protein [candidate division WOR-3 bacterium]
MTEETQSFYKELGKVLAKYRKSARLSQAELAKRIGLSKKRGYCHISELENGRTKKPSLDIILRYLKVCQVPWPKFFQELAQIDFRIEHEKILSQIEMPSTLTPQMRQKVDRDTALYETKIQYPKAPFPKLDWERIKIKVDKKVKELLFNHQLTEDQKTPYFTFVKELIDNYDNPQVETIFEKYYRSKELNWRIVSEIRSIIYKIVRTEQKRLLKPKPLPKEKISMMAGEFLKYRIKIEPIEEQVQKKLGELVVPTIYNQAYKDFARECFSVFKKFYHKDPMRLTQRLTEIKKIWQAKGLNEEVMDAIKEIVIQGFAKNK